MNTTVDPKLVKAESEAQIKSRGGQICDWLPWLDHNTPREKEAVCNRALCMHAMIQIAFGAPRPVIRAWLERNRLLHALSSREQKVLESPEADLDPQTNSDLHWYIEAVWALVWVGSFIPDLEVTEPVGSNLASLLPDLRVNETGDAFRSRFELRPFSEVFRALDLYYRAHWYSRNGQLNGYSTAPFDLDRIMERRKALEWVSDVAIPDWDETPTDT